MTALLLAVAVNQGPGTLIPPAMVVMFAFVFGTIVGSFLNVCIHRMPRGHSIVAPRSRCYSCDQMIEWHDNIPILSYLVLGGKCRKCGAPFSSRYMLVEALTGILFVVLWMKFSPALATAYTIFVCGLIVATFIDFEHLIIPDELNYGGIIVGVICSGLLPAMQRVSGPYEHSIAALWSLAGAVIGYGSLWGVVELGKRLLGIEKITLEQPTAIRVTRDTLRLGDESEPLEELFMRPSDTLSFHGEDVRLGECDWPLALVQVRWNEVQVNDQSFPIEQIGELSAVTSTIFKPREAMGFGDVKFIAAIGAFLGPMSLFFVILVSSLAGSVVGLLPMLFGKQGWGVRIPYGPYLAFAALVWVLGGSEWFASYINSLSR